MRIFTAMKLSDISADLGGQNPEHPLAMDSDWNIYGSVQGLGYFKTNLDGTSFTIILETSTVDRVRVLSSALFQMFRWYRLQIKVQFLVAALSLL